ncbi:hypothetical protein [Micromonospora sp. NPDC092111]|uniref:hypothetical protein n=1 Tax=Micromonospora sp. NPDC092111 TaxID=3364289 RepID=UPI0038168113
MAIDVMLRTEEYNFILVGGKSMPRKNEATLAGWTGKASDSEDVRYQWTKEQISEAIKACSFDGNSYDVYPKGSYPNHTNVVRDSDVDIAVELTGLTRHEFIHGASGLSLRDFGIPVYTGSYNVLRFKNEVEAALVDRFGRAAVERGNKAIHVRESARSLKADVVVCQTLISHSSRHSERQGILIRPDNGGEIHNFPKQHLSEGVAKNERTYRRYKRTVRILKRLENEMVDVGAIDAVPSFLIESLVFNVSNGVFNNHATWTERVRGTLNAIARTYKERDGWVEANNIKYLFHDSQPWTETQADFFARTALAYLELD